MMNTRATSLLALAALLVSPAYAGGGGPFEAEVDCDGFFSAGDTVPWQIRFENRTFQNQPLAVAVNLQVPAIGTISLINVSFNLGPNQNLNIPRTLNLPGQARNGEYQFTITATSGTTSTFDTCSFDVF